MTPEQKVCFRAAQLIERHGFAHRDYETKEGCLCIIGAVRKAASGSALEYSNYANDAATLVRSALGDDEKPLLSDNIPKWNDTHTAEEAIDLLVACSMTTFD